MSDGSPPASSSMAARPAAVTPPRVGDLHHRHHHHKHSVFSNLFRCKKPQHSHEENCPVGKTIACISKGVFSAPSRAYTNHAEYLIAQAMGGVGSATEELAQKVALGELNPKEVVDGLSRQVRAEPYTPENELMVLCMLHRIVTGDDGSILYALDKCESGIFLPPTLGLASAPSAVDEPAGGPDEQGAPTDLAHVAAIYRSYIQVLCSFMGSVLKAFRINLLRRKYTIDVMSSYCNGEHTLETADAVQKGVELMTVIATLPIPNRRGNRSVHKVIEAICVDAFSIYVFCRKVFVGALHDGRGLTGIVATRRWLRVVGSFGPTVRLLDDFLKEVNTRFGIETPAIPAYCNEQFATVRAEMEKYLKSFIVATEGGVDVYDQPPPQEIHKKLIALKKQYMCANLSDPTTRPDGRPPAIDIPPAAAAHDGDEPRTTVTASQPPSTPASPSDSEDFITGFRIASDAKLFVQERAAKPPPALIQSAVNSLMSTAYSIGNSSIVSASTNVGAGDDPETVPAGSLLTLSESQKSISDVTSGRFVTFAGEVLGKGSYGTVCKGWDEEEGRPVAVKSINVGRAGDKARTELLDEFKLLTSLNHPNIVSVFAFEAAEDTSRIFMEWVPGGSVQAVLEKTATQGAHGLKENVIRRYMKDALEALAFVHKEHVVHRDIKLGNMLLDASGHIKLTDFGTSRLLQENQQQAGNQAATQSIVGTIPYLAPENFRGSYSCASDIYALGASALHMSTGLMPWSELRITDSLTLLFAIGSKQPPNHMPAFGGTPDTVLADLPAPSPEFRDFMVACLTHDAAARPTAAQLLEHPFIVLKSPLVPA